ncbi:hypothetical protein M758_10G099100 [Ceratodon purpureus]|uniref:Uncharacterized protein n=1 Tax=Ceratodon purpureus TaxID=3225 RepID=A0A8T0GIQ7_CERPU|nr:hypothetical protein KC19_10G101200 [Ceratodon purpureus]KAG0603513.1 hypothetical protein M758_10G099100 [Ceratodon purpureus]
MPNRSPFPTSSMCLQCLLSTAIVYILHQSRHRMQSRGANVKFGPSRGPGLLIFPE